MADLLLPTEGIKTIEQPPSTTKAPKLEGEFQFLELVSKLVGSVPCLHARYLPLGQNDLTTEGADVFPSRRREGTKESRCSILQNFLAVV